MTFTDGSTPLATVDGMSNIDLMNAAIRPGENAETAYYEHVVFAKINIRAPEGNTESEFPKLIDTLDASFSGKGLRFAESGWPTEWEVSRFYLQDLHSTEGEQLLNFESRVLLFTFRSTTDAPGPQIVSIDRQERWVATSMPARFDPQWAAIRSSRYDMVEQLERLIRSVTSSQLDQTAVMYDVDLICSTATIRAWLESHQFITSMELSTLPTNPGIDFKPIRRHLRLVKARLSTEHFQAYPSQKLDIGPDFATELGEETENGNARVAFTAPPLERFEFDQKFDSNESSDTEDINASLSPLQAMVRVVTALIHRRVRPAQ